MTRKRLLGSTDAKGEAGARAFKNHLLSWLYGVPRRWEYKTDLIAGSPEETDIR